MKLIAKMLCMIIDALLYVVYGTVCGVVVCIGMILTVIMIPFDMIGISHK